MYVTSVCIVKSMEGRMKRCFIFLFCLVCAAALNAEEAVDDFGFDSEAESGSAFSIDIGGKLSLGGSFYFNDF